MNSGQQFPMNPNRICLKNFTMNSGEISGIFSEKTLEEYLQKNNLERHVSRNWSKNHIRNSKRNDSRITGGIPETIFKENTRRVHEKIVGEIPGVVSERIRKRISAWIAWETVAGISGWDLVETQARKFQQEFPKKLLLLHNGHFTVFVLIWTT